MGHNFERPVDRQPTQRSKLALNPHQHQHKTTMTFSICKAITLGVCASTLLSGAAALAGAPRGRRLMQPISLPIHLPDGAFEEGGVFQQIGQEVLPHEEKRVPTIDMTQLDEIENSPDSVGQGYGHTVNVGSDPAGKMTFSPATVKIGKDETVTFINEDGLQHDVRFTGVPAGVDASSLNQGSWDTQFDTVSITLHERCLPSERRHGRYRHCCLKLVSER